MKLKNTDALRRVRCLALSLLMVVTTVGGTVRAGFDASAAPPRFELKAKPGEVVRQAVEISNHSGEPARYLVKTADWELGAAGEAQFQEAEPGVGSCRPWVRIERREISVAPNDTRHFRFEVHVPENAAKGECRFALLVSSDAGTVSPRGGGFIQIPIVGRLGIIVYVAIGDAKPAMDLERIVLKKVDGKRQPVATFRNHGTAHSRVLGSLEVLDAARHNLNLVANEGVVLPNATREITLSPVDWSTGEAKSPAYELVPPLHVRGVLRYLDGGEIKIDQVLR
jgi:fimbrial chaperone protein